MLLLDFSVCSINNKYNIGKGLVDLMGLNILKNII